MLIDDHEFEELNPIIHENEEEEEGFIEAENGGSFMSFLLGGLFANMIMPKKEKTIKLQEIHKPNPSANLMSQEEKDFLSCIWSIEKEIKKAEKDVNGFAFTAFSKQSDILTKLSGTNSSEEIMATKESSIKIY